MWQCICSCCQQDTQPAPHEADCTLLSPHLATPWWHREDPMRKKTQPGDVLHQLAKDMATAKPAHSPSSAQNCPCQELKTGFALVWLFPVSPQSRRMTYTRRFLLLRVTVTQQLPCSAPLVATKWCHTLTTLPARCMGSLGMCNAYLNFHMCHQDCKVGEVVAGARGVCLVSCQEATALGGPIPCHCTLCVAPEWTVRVKIFFWLLQGRN